MQSEGRQSPETNQYSAEKLKLPRNVAEVERPWAHFRIAYGDHDKVQAVADVEGSNYIYLEDPYKKSDSESAHSLIKDRERPGEQYSSILKYAKYNKIPIVFADLDSGSEKLHLQQILKALEAVGGVALVAELLKNLAKRQMSRRDVLKGMAAAWIGTQALNLIPYSEFKGTIIGDIKRVLSGVQQTLHPETEIFVTELRNYLLAHKMEFEAQKIYKETGKRNTITCIIGGNHLGIERALQTDPLERIKVIERIINLPGAGEFKNNISTVAKMIPDANTPDGWRDEISSNKNLFDPKEWQKN